MRKWYRFNDYKVLEVEEATVFEESFGDNAKKSCAYGLIYVDKDITAKQELLSFNQFNASLR